MIVTEPVEQHDDDVAGSRQAEKRARRRTVEPGDGHAKCVERRRNQLAKMCSCEVRSHEPCRAQVRGIGHVLAPMTS